jgi:hypothetical protein
VYGSNSLDTGEMGFGCKSYGVLFRGVPGHDVMPPGCFRFELMISPNFVSDAVVYHSLAGGVARGRATSTSSLASRTMIVGTCSSSAY